MHTSVHHEDMDNCVVEHSFHCHHLVDLKDIDSLIHSSVKSVGNRERWETADLRQKKERGENWTWKAFKNHYNMIVLCSFLTKTGNLYLHKYYLFTEVLFCFQERTAHTTCAKHYINIKYEQHNKCQSNHFISWLFK